jgi:glycosyltransferase involved in cell wall biosynthesis
MTAKNASKTIIPAIVSLQISLQKSDEILVLCDGCSDDTEEKVRGISDPRVKVFSVSKSLGRSKGRNYLIDRSHGDLIGILDADDIALPWRFWVAKRLLQRFDAVFSTAIVFGFALKPFPILPQVPRQILPDAMAMECLGRNPLVHSSATFKRELLGSEPPYRDSETEEYDLWLRMLLSGARIYRAAVPCVLYRLHSSQASQVEGFVERSQSCKLVQHGQRVLAAKLGISGESIEVLREQALDAIRAKGFFAKLEVLGWSGIKGLFN